MKKLLFIIITLIFSLGCTEQDTNSANPSNALLGTWQLIAVLADPGDGSGTFIPVDSDAIITFNADGSFVSSHALCNSITTDSTINTSGTYDITTMILLPDNCSQLGDAAGFNIFFSLTEGELILSLPCIEPCGQRFKKIS